MVIVFYPDLFRQWKKWQGLKKSRPVGGLVVPQGMGL